ncbi:MAG: PhoH family protein [Bacteroidaceae bacterium]|jgi:PhoH-like ATPase
MGTKKNFVLDTNVILHDASCLEHFQENNVYLSVAVLEELDRFKKGSEQINYNARSFIRYLDEITDDNLFTDGAPLCGGQGRLFIKPSTLSTKRVNEAFPEKKADHIILGLADWLATNDPKQPTILVTKDMNLRMKARSIHIVAEDYTTDKVPQTQIFENTNRTFEGIASELIDRIYSSRDGIPIEDLGELKDKIIANECFVLKSERSSVLARFNPFQKTVKRVLKSKHFGIEPRNTEQTFALEVLTDPEVKLVSLTGKAGTGKTLLALAAALSQMSEYKQILLARPIIALSNKDLGYLPGNAQEKVAPYMQPLFDNLNVIRHQFAPNSSEVKKIEDLQKSGQLVIEALAFIRGRSLSETYCIIDEAQNLTPHEIKTIVTRAGEGTKIVFTGDLQQIDQPYLDAESNGLIYMINRMRGQNLFAHINLVRGERSELAELASNLL